MPTGTVFGTLLLRLGVAFGVSASPALQGHEPTCMVWSAALLLAHVLEPATRAQSMWLTTLVSVLYRRSICVDCAAQAAKDAENAEETESDRRPNTAKKSVKRMKSTQSTSTSVSTSIRTCTTTTTTKSESTTRTSEEPSVIIISDSE